jgi:ribonuclease R
VDAVVAGSAASTQAGSRARERRAWAGIRRSLAARESERYAEPIASREAILGLLAEADGPQNAEDLARQLRLTEPDRFEALSRRLHAMVRDGQVVQNRRGGMRRSSK